MDREGIFSPTGPEEGKKKRNKKIGIPLTYELMN